MTDTPSYSDYPAYFNGDTILAQPVQELAEPTAILLGIPWGHNITLIQKLKGSLPTIAEIEKELGPA